MKDIREGCFGAEVQILKERLNLLNYDCGPGDEWDRRTTWAVRWFCRQNGLPVFDSANASLWEKIWDPDALLGVTTAFQYYSMTDPLWADYPYDAANTPEIERMSNSGCGPTSMAIAISTALHKAVLPPVLADWSNANGHRDPDGIHGTYDSFFPAAAQRYGLSAFMMPAEGVSSFVRVSEELAKGNAVISNVVPGSPFTHNGHYNLISSIQDSRVHICDPIPSNNQLPCYTVQDWAEGHWARHFIVIVK